MPDDIRPRSTRDDTPRASRQVPFRRRAAGLGVALALPVALLGAGPASAAEARDPRSWACPEGEVTSPFTDTTGNVHAFAIDCAATYGITSGATPTTYAPARIVTRGQMASLLREVLVAGEVPMSTADQGYTDISGNVHEEAINAITSAGVASGTSATTFSPSAPVSRAQLATFLLSTLTLSGAFLPIGPDAFDDDAGNVHEMAIDTMALHGVTAGVGGRRYDPSGPVRRDAMASFVMRAVDVGVEHGDIRSAFEADQRYAAMTPEQVVGGGEADASGAARVWTIAQPDVVCFDMITREVGSGSDQPEIGAYLALGDRGEAGELLVELPPPNAAEHIPFEAAHAAEARCVRTTPEVVALVADHPEQLHLGLVTRDHPVSLRGQLGRVGLPLFAELDGDAVVPGPGDADGGGHITVSPTSQPDHLCWAIAVTGVATVTDVGIHTGAAGDEGEPLVALAPVPGPDGAIRWCAGEVDADVVDAIVAAPADHHVVVATVDHPAGALRGQLG